MAKRKLPRAGADLLIDVRSRRLIAAVAAGLGGRLATLVAPLIATPMMLHYFGEAIFGVWATAVSITSIAVFADFGIGNGLLTRIGAAFGRGDNEDIRRYVASAYAALGTVAAGFIAVAIVCLPLLSIPEATIVVSVLVVFFAGLPATVFHQLLYGLQRVPASNFFLTLGAILSLTCSFVAVSLHWAPWLVAVAYALPPVLVSFAGALWFFARRPEFRPGLDAVRWDYSRDLLALGSSFFALSVLMAIGLNVDNLIISIKAGVSAVTAYSITARLGSILSLLILTIFMPLWAANGEALAKKEYLWVKRKARHMSILGFLLITVSGIVLILLSDRIMVLWVGQTFPDQHLILGFVVVTSMVIAATSPYNMILNSMGRATVQIWPWLAFVLLSIPVKFFVVEPGHLWPAAAITGVAYVLLISPAILLAVRREFGEL